MSNPAPPLLPPGAHAPPLEPVPPLQPNPALPWTGPQGPPGPTGPTGATGPQGFPDQAMWNALVARVAVLEARPVINSLDDLVYGPA